MQISVQTAKYLVDKAILGFMAHFGIVNINKAKLLAIQYAF
jgi:hypothetical protein